MQEDKENKKYIYSQPCFQSFAEICKVLAWKGEAGRHIHSPSINRYFFFSHDKTQCTQSLDPSLVLSKDVFVSSNLGSSEDKGAKAFQDNLWSPMIIRLQHYSSY